MLFVTSFCNQAHNLKNGRPVGHECYVLPPRALAAEREGNLHLANQILSSTRLQAVKTRKVRDVIVYLPSDNRYDKPFKYLPKHDAYLITLQTKTTKLPEIYDVVPGHGDRALPKGFVIRWHKRRNYRAFLYKPGHSGDIENAVELGESGNLNEAIAAILQP